jgi:hypothetical protein
MAGVTFEKSCTLHMLCSLFLVALSTGLAEKREEVLVGCVLHGACFFCHCTASCWHGQPAAPDRALVVARALPLEEFVLPQQQGQEL